MPAVYRSLLSQSLWPLLGRQKDQLEMIYTYVATHIKIHEKEEFGGRILATEDQFKAVIQCEQLLELVRKVAS